MITAYRRGEEYELEPPPGGEWEPVLLATREGVRAERSAHGEMLIYRGFLAYGTRVHTAVALGWCWPDATQAQQAPALSLVG